MMSKMRIQFDQMNDKELLKMLIRENGESVSDGLLSDRSLPELVYDTAPEELGTVRGLTKARLQQILALQTIVHRISCINYRSQIAKLTHPREVYDLVKASMMYLKQEEFRILILNNRSEVIKSVTISIGTANAALVHPRDVFRHAIKTGACFMILVHNHPSGNPSPSEEDKALTKRLVDAGELLGIAIRDHVIIGDSGRYFSFKEHGVCL